MRNPCPARAGKLLSLSGATYQTYIPDQCSVPWYWENPVLLIQATNMVTVFRRYTVPYLQTRRVVRLPVPTVCVGLAANQIMWLSPRSQPIPMFSVHSQLTPLIFQPLRLALEELHIPPSGLTWTNCGLSFSADSGHMALQLCNLLAELALLLSELLQLLAHLPELLHKGSTFNLVAL